MPMRSNTRRWKWAWALAGLAIAAALWLAWRAQPQPLLKRATRVAPCWPDNQYYRSLFWVSGHEILIEQDTQYGENTADTQFFRLDTSTGKEMPLAGLNAVVKKHTPGVGGWQISPDRQRLLFSDWGYNHYNGVAFGVIGLDGTGLQEFPRPSSSGDMLWLHDGREWATLEPGENSDDPSEVVKPQLIVDSLDSPHELCLSLQGSREAVRAVNDGRLLGFLPNGHALVLANCMGPQNAHRPDGDFCEFAVEPNATIRSYTISLPPGAEVHGVSLSPQGTRLAWFVDRDYSAVRPTPTERFERLLGVRPPAHAVELWTSDVAGQNRHLIGYHVAPSDADFIPLLLWSPDGKRLLFDYKESLYTIPTD